MAKLSSHGKELVRFEQTESRDDGRVRRTYALMENGAVLSKVDWRRHDGSRNGTGWKRIHVFAGMDVRTRTDFDLATTGVTRAVFENHLTKLGFVRA